MTTTYKAGEFEVRADERRVLARGRPQGLGGRAFDLLLALIEHRDRVVGKSELMALVVRALQPSPAPVDCGDSIDRLST